jgi:hypothetical protein
LKFALEMFSQDKVSMLMVLSGWYGKTLNLDFLGGLPLAILRKLIIE